MAGSATGDNFTTREEYTLGRYRHLGLLEYRDLDAYYCTGCNILYNVKCPNCGLLAQFKEHLPLGKVDDAFVVNQPLTIRKDRGLYWTPAQCRKCDFKFLVIVR